MRETEKIKNKIFEISPALRKFAEEVSYLIERTVALNWTELAMLGDQAVAD
jgi:hypothetical protein